MLELKNKRAIFLPKTPRQQVNVDSGQMLFIYNPLSNAHLLLLHTIGS